MKKTFLFLAIVLLMQGCSTKAPELKSPCVGAEGSPCGPRVPVNDWWLS